MIALLFCGVAVVLLGVFLVGYARRFYGVLEKLNVPVIKPHFLLGSDPDGYKVVQHDEDIRRMHKYGRIYGVYSGSNPQIHINDPELIKLMMVKDFEHFNERQEVDFGHPVINDILDWLPKAKWKAVRHEVTQTLTSSKFKHMSEVLVTIAEDHVNHLKNEKCAGDRMPFDFRRWFGVVATDLCGKCYFGIEFKNVKDQNNEVTTLFRDLMGEHWQHNFFTYNIPTVFPFVRSLVPVLPKRSVDRLSEIILGMIKHRKKCGAKQNDPADIFASFLDKLDSPDYKAFRMTEGTVIIQVMEAFFATYDSTGTTSSSLIYYLAKHPRHQERLLKEVDSIFKKSDGKLIYENISDSEMPFMTACFSEAARLTPGFIRSERICTQDWEHEGIRIPKGQVVVFPLWATNRNPDYHEDPDLFNPERFLGESKSSMNPYAFSSFGHGPMNCPGMRWAYQMNKIILLRFLKDFRVEMRNDTKVAWRPGNTFVPQCTPVIVDLVKRN